MLNQQKSQSALEFLTTYGWAFLIILIMIGALAYFGILSPSKLTSNRCNFGSEWGCLDYQISASTSTIKLRLQNNIGKPVTIVNIAVGTGGTNSLDCTTAPAVPPTFPATNIKAGEARDFVWTSCTSATVGMPAVGILQGEKTKLNVTINYYAVTSSNAYTQQTRGEVYTGAV